MLHTLKGMTRKLLSLAAMCVPLTLLVLSACGGGSSSTGTGTSTGSSGSNTWSAGFTCASNCPGSTGSTGTTSTTTTTAGASAVAVIGQTSFTTSTAGTTAATLYDPYGDAAVNPTNGNLFIGDSMNNRILAYPGVPTTNGVAANLVLGQPNFTSYASGVSATTMYSPAAPVFSTAAGTAELLFADGINNRIGIYGTVPTTSPGTLSLVVGQTSLSSAVAGCSATTYDNTFAVSAGGGKMAVADFLNSRVLLYNTIPTTNGASASIVLGQSSMGTCVTGATAANNTLNFPSGVWTDGTRVVVVDSANNRVLIWNTWPTTNGQAADIVLGQANFTSSSAGVSSTAMNLPLTGVFVESGGALLVTDSGNNRVLIWNTFPTTNGKAADAVLGQANFTSSTAGTSATTLNVPTGVVYAAGHVIVTDSGNNRLMVY